MYLTRTFLSNKSQQDHSAGPLPPSYGEMLPSSSTTDESSSPREERAATPPRRVGRRPDEDHSRDSDSMSECLSDFTYPDTIASSPGGNDSQLASPFGARLLAASEEDLGASPFGARLLAASSSSASIGPCGGGGTSLGAKRTNNDEKINEGGRNLFFGDASGRRVEQAEQTARGAAAIDGVLTTTEAEGLRVREAEKLCETPELAPPGSPGRVLNFLDESPKLAPSMVAKGLQKDHSENLLGARSRMKPFQGRSHFSLCLGLGSWSVLHVLCRLHQERLRTPVYYKTCSGLLPSERGVFL